MSRSPGYQNHGTWPGWEDSFNRYFSMIQAGAAAVIMLVLGFKALVKIHNDFEERVSNLSALNGLSGRPLEWLSQQAKDLSTTTLDGTGK